MDPGGGGFFRSEVAAIKSVLTETEPSERFLCFKILGRSMERYPHKNLDTRLISDYNPEYEIGLKGECIV